MNRILSLTAALCLAAILTACSTPPPVLKYSGVSTTSDAVHEVTLALQPVTSGNIYGTYYTGVAPGTLRGTLDGTSLTAELQPSPDCTYQLSGVLTETSLTGTFELLDCPGGQPGAWDLTRD